MAKDETPNQVPTKVTPVLHSTSIPPSSAQSGVGPRQQSTSNDGKGK